MRFLFGQCLLLVGFISSPIISQAVEFYSCPPLKATINGNESTIGTATSFRIIKDGLHASITCYFSDQPAIRHELQLARGRGEQLIYQSDNFILSITSQHRSDQEKAVQKIVQLTYAGNTEFQSHCVPTRSESSLP